MSLWVASYFFYVPPATPELQLDKKKMLIGSTLPSVLLRGVQVCKVQRKLFGLLRIAFFSFITGLWSSRAARGKSEQVRECVKVSLETSQIVFFHYNIPNFGIIM